MGVRLIPAGYAFKHRTRSGFARNRARSQMKKSRTAIAALVLALAPSIDRTHVAAAQEVFSPQPLTAVEALPKDAIAPVLAKFPRATLVSQAACNVGGGRLPAYALAITEAENPGPRGSISVQWQ